MLVGKFGGATRKARAERDTAKQHEHGQTAAAHQPGSTARDDFLKFR